MRCNVGKTERFIRLAAAFGLICAGVLWQQAFAWLGVLVLLTGLMAWCPLRAVLGSSSCDDKESEEIPADTTGTPKDAADRRRRFK